MCGARLIPIFLGALALLASACGTSSQERPSSVLQASLRALARGAPAGGHAYWLGPQFRRAPLRFADNSWGRYAILTYSRLLDAGLAVDVESFRSRAAGPVKGFPVLVHTATGQDVVLVFHVPRRPDAALIRAAKAALQPIPPGVTYPTRIGP
jgi:hypothetical protein